MPFPHHDRLSDDVVGIVEYSPTIGKSPIVFFPTADNNLVELAQTCTCRYEMTTDDILLHALKVVALTIDSGIVEDLGGLLE